MDSNTVPKGFKKWGYGTTDWMHKGSGEIISPDPKRALEIHEGWLVEEARQLGFWVARQLPACVEKLSREPSLDILIDEFGFKLHARMVDGTLVVTSDFDRMEG